MSDEYLIRELEIKITELNREILDFKGEIMNLKDKIQKLEGVLEIKSEFISTRQCPDHNGKWPRGTCLQCEVERLKAQLADIVSFESAALRKQIKAMDKVIEAADYLKVEFLEDWKLNRLSIDTKDAAIAYENKRKALAASLGDSAEKEDDLLAKQIIDPLAEYIVEAITAANNLSQWIATHEFPLYTCTLEFDELTRLADLQDTAVRRVLEITGKRRSE